MTKVLPTFGYAGSKASVFEPRNDDCFAANDPSFRVWRGQTIERHVAYRIYWNAGRFFHVHHMHYFEMVAKIKLAIYLMQVRSNQILSKI